MTHEQVAEASAAPYSHRVLRGSEGGIITNQFVSIKPWQLHTHDLDLWVTHDSTTKLLNFVSKEEAAKKYEDQFSNRLAALGR